MSCVNIERFLRPIISLLFICFFLLANMLNAQPDSIPQPSFDVWGVVRDAKTSTPLAYATIYVPGLEMGTVSNEDGQFLMSIPEGFSNDSLRFQFIGYRSQTWPVHDFRQGKIVALQEDIVDLSEWVIYGTNPDARYIVKQVLENKDANYKKPSSHSRVFTRQRYTTKMVRMQIGALKSSLKEFQADEIAMLQRTFPKVSLSFTDFLGNVYFSAKQPDTSAFKIRPERIVKLEEKKSDELKHLEKVFNDILKRTGEDAYWKVRTGVLSKKIDISEPDSASKDSVKAGKTRTAYFKWRIRGYARFTSLEDDKYWDFLHNTGRYSYTFIGGTRIDGEEVYIVGFEPEWRGLFCGKLYISTSTYALLRADFGYAPSKSGSDFDLFGISYIQNQLQGSVSFKKMGDVYVPKNISYKSGQVFGVNRKVSFVKKRNRFLFDKTEDEVKLDIDIISQSESSVEVLVIDESPISEVLFNNVVERKFTNVHYVDKFDESLWKGYSIIEPNETMRDFSRPK